MLNGKSLTQLRGIAQSYNVDDIFSKDEAQLRQAIELKQKELQPAPKIEIPVPPYDARLMTKPPAKRLAPEDLMPLLEPFIARGLKFEVVNNGENWRMAFDKKRDMGNMRMPPRVILLKAREMLA